MAKKTEYDMLQVGDLILYAGCLWEIVTPSFEDEDELGENVVADINAFCRNGEILSYAVRGYRRRDYHEIILSDIEKAWTRV